MCDSPFSALTFSTFALHSISYVVLGAFSADHSREDAVTIVLTLVFLGWAVWAITALTGLLKAAGQRSSQLNEELRQNQKTLEQRIATRTKELQESQALLVQQEKQAAFGLLAAGIAHEVGTRWHPSAQSCRCCRERTRMNMSGNVCKWWTVSCSASSEP